MFAVYRTREWLWIGGRKSSTNWSWNGRIDTQIHVADWEQLQPDSSFRKDGCIQVFGLLRASSRHPTWQNFKWDDTECTNPRQFVCEKILHSEKSLRSKVLTKFPEKELN